MSDLEYDSGDSSEDNSAEDSGLQTAGAEAAGGEQETAEEPSLKDGDERPVEEDESEEEEEEEEGSEGEEQRERGSPVEGEGEGEGPSDDEGDKSFDTTAESGPSPEKAAKNVRAGAFLDSSGESDNEGDGGGNMEDEEEGERGAEMSAAVEEGESGRTEEVSKVGGGGRKFLEDSDDEEEETNTTGEVASDNTEQQKSRTESTSQEDVFGSSDDEGEESRGRKRKRDSVSGEESEVEDEQQAGEEEEEEVKAKRPKEGSDDEEASVKGQESDEEGEGEGEGDKGEGEEREGGEEEEGEGEGVPEVGGEKDVSEERGEEEDDEEPGPSTAGMSDWDVMMQRRKEAMARARRRRKRDIDITAVDDHIMAMIREMRQAVQEDRQLNQARQPALKKLKMLPTVMLNLKKSDLQTSFIECGILTVLAEWLSPLPDRSLPHLKIRESILDILKTYPVPESHILKSSRIGKAVMLLYKHPKETRKNKEKASKIINEWARPIFGLASDFKSLGRDEREERDYANLSQANKRRLSSSSDPSKKNAQEEEYEPAKPGDKGWIGRARVPMPSTKDYVVRPKWKVEHEFKRGPSKKMMNRYEKQINKEKQRKMRGKTSHAVSISVEGRKMPL